MQFLVFLDMIQRTPAGHLMTFLLGEACPPAAFYTIDKHARAEYRRTG